MVQSKYRGYNIIVFFMGLLARYFTKCSTTRTWVFRVLHMWNCSKQKREKEHKPEQRADTSAPETCSLNQLYPNKFSVIEAACWRLQCSGRGRSFPADREFAVDVAARENDETRSRRFQIWSPTIKLSAKVHAQWLRLIFPPIFTVGPIVISVVCLQSDSEISNTVPGKQCRTQSKDRIWWPLLTFFVTK